MPSPLPFDKKRLERVRHGLSLPTRNPLDFWHHSSDKTRRATRALAQKLEVFLRAGNKAGKAQPVGEPVLTPSGWRTIGSLRPGDEVFSGEGEPTEVVGVFPQGSMPVFRVTFNDGSWTRCTMDHLWEVRDHRQRFHGDYGVSVLSLADIERLGGDNPSAANRVAIRRCLPILFPRRDVPLDPYSLGVLLGDGCFTPSSVTLTTCDEEIADRLNGFAPDGCWLVRMAQRDRAPSYIYTTRSVGGDASTRPRNMVLESIRALGLGGLHAADKFVPETYSFNAVDVRLEVLRGLMDTDGYCDKKGRTHFYTTSPRLAQDMRWLVESLGGRASILPKTTSINGREFASFCVNLRMVHDCPFRLERKAKRWRVARSRTNDRLLVSITPESDAECVCIAVAAKSQTYLTRSCIVTHNTNWGAAVVVALCQRRKELDGVKLPKMPERVIAAVLSLDHQQQALSVQPAYLAMLGDWPHVVGYKSRSQDIVGTIRVKQVDNKSDDPKTWSTIHFVSQENPNATVGARLHIAHADEPPKEHIWNEVRARGFAGQPFVRLITATPLVRRQWTALQNWFPKDFTGTPHRGRLELKLSVYDNKFLTSEDIARLEQDYEGDPLKDARLNGEYIDTTGSCPFDERPIQELLKDCRTPKLVKFEVVRDADGEKESADLEVWEEPDPKESYYVPIDASAGIDSKLHDPSGLQVWARGRVRLVARYNGYLPPYELGTLAANVGVRYNRALLDPETTGGWGASVIKAIQQAGYGNIARQQRDLRPGEWELPLGFVTTMQSRPTMIAAIQDFLASVRDKKPVAEVWSADVLRCWLDTILDPTGKPIAAPGLHDEDLILAGQALKRLTRKDMRAAERPGERKGWDLSRIFARHKERGRAGGGRLVPQLNQPRFT